jgi:hypothetical protein
MRLLTSGGVLRQTVRTLEGWGADKTGTGRSGVEGKLLLGHAPAWSGCELGNGRRIVRRPALGGSRLVGQAVPETVRQSAAGRRWG